LFFGRIHRDRRRDEELAGAVAPHLEIGSSLLGSLVAS
jgi:hypothetical protein